MAAKIAKEDPIYGTIRLLHDKARQLTIRSGQSIGENAVESNEKVDDSFVESQQSADEDSVDAGCFEGEEPTEEEGDDPCSKEETNHEESGENSDKGAETNSEEISPCSSCGSTEEPQFLHYKKVQKCLYTEVRFLFFQITGLAGGTYVWRYRCGQKDCAQFFGDFYAYDKISNSFVRVSEDGAAIEDTECEANEEVTTEAPEGQSALAGESTADSPSEEKQEHHAGDVDTTTKPSADSRSRRRQRLTARKKTSTPVAVKSSSTNKKSEKRTDNKTNKAVHKAPPNPPFKSSSKALCKAPPKTPAKATTKATKSPKSAKASKTTTAKRRNEKDPVTLDAETPVKKARKGYVYEPIPPPVQNMNVSILENSTSIHVTTQPSYCESATQTMGGTHYFSVLIEQLINGQADFCSGTSSDGRPQLPTHVSRRLLVSQQLLKRQSDELVQAHEENKRLMSLVNLMNTVIKKFRDEYTPELRHLRDAIGVLKREFSFYQDEFVAEAKKSIDNINAQKNEVQRRIDDVERKNRLLNARIDLHVKEKEAVEERADGYLRDISARDRDVILANKARDRAERKLNDTLYVANNAKCAHCQISDKMRKHLTDVVAEKTVLLEKCQKECTDAVRRADHADRISQILSKDSEKLRFELNRWKSDAERNIIEITRLKEELRKVGSPSTGGPVTNMIPANQIRAEPNTPKQSAYAVDSVASNHVGKPVASNDPSEVLFVFDVRNSSPEGPAKLLPNSAEESVMRAPLIPPVMPTPPEEPDSPFTSWLPKDRKAEHSPPISFFNSPSVTSRHGGVPPAMRKPHPFNGPVISDRSAGKLDAAGFSPSSIETNRKSISKNGEKLMGQNSSKAAEPTLSVATTSQTGKGNVQQNSPRKIDQVGSSDTVPMIGKLPSKITKKNQKQEVTATEANGGNTATSRLFDLGSQSAGAQKSVQQIAKPGVGMVAGAQQSVQQIAKPGKPKPSKNAKKKMLRAQQQVASKAIQPLMSIRGPTPFNGPVFAGIRPAARSSPQPHPVETMRTRFSSSPLPWHRGGTAADYDAWERDGK
ncbi:hypothetical protein Y032_0260g522 [Ancylostoma ceylanicum]|uniref:Uncharacterized protein n=1 Tax=Ancylostoma ceylanicum TaxID=53326 RepID=A0A016SB68_9BILA|nr:hypothetical protein Y032_0260g522 [Ancylostoma ceylanicum]